MEKSKNLVKRAAAFFYKDFHWKMLSLALAFVLWFVGINVNNPVQPVTYDNLPLTVLHRDQLALNDAMILNEQQVNNTRISASIRATRSNHALIQTARNDNIQASIDLSTINFDEVFEGGSPVSVYVDVDVFIHQDYISRTMRPYRVEVVLDRHGSLTLPVQVDLQGTPYEGFELRTPIVSQSLVRITGPRSVLDEVSEVQVRVDIDEAYETVEGVYPLVVFNNRREDMTSAVSLSIQAVHIQVPIWPYANIPMAVNTVGTVASGFTVTEIRIEPPVASVMGNAEEIAGTVSVPLGELDIDGIDQTLELTFDIRQALSGTGLVLSGNAVSEAVVTVVVEQIITRDMQLPLANLTVRGYQQSFNFVSQSPITVSVRGRASIVHALNLGQITASLDLAGLGAGTHQVPVSITVPGEVSLVNPITIGIIIEPEPTVPEPDEEPDPTEGLNGADGTEGGEENDPEHYENRENDEDIDDEENEAYNTEGELGSGEIGEDSSEYYH